MGRPKVAKDPHPVVCLVPFACLHSYWLGMTVELALCVRTPPMTVAYRSQHAHTAGGGNHGAAVPLN